MKKLMFAVLGVGIALSTVSAANAADGCGRGGHRGPHGHCRPNGGPGPVLVAPGGLIVGNYYGNRGYWDGHRYWQHRDRWQGGWRYR